MQRLIFSNCQQRRLNCCCTELYFLSLVFFRFINFFKKKLLLNWTVSFCERKWHLPRGALLEIGNFGPRNSVGLCVEMTAGLARSPPSCRVGEEGWCARESRPPSSPSPRLHISTHRWRSGVCTTPDSRTHEEERKRERTRTP